MFSQRPSAHDVFTPRSQKLNPKTYAVRKTLEQRLQRAVKGDKYIVLHGESGNGKTWLYKKVFEEIEVPYQVVNLANMHTEGSLKAVLEIKLSELGFEEETSKTVEAEGGIKPAGIGASIKTSYSYEGKRIGIVEALGLQMRKVYKRKKSIIVLDNFEQVSNNQKFVEEVSALIISADEEGVAETGIKFLIVGTPSNIMEMMSNVVNAATISNRFMEVPEVARLELGESRHIMSQGFEKHLNFTFLVEKNSLFKDLAFKTDGIAQEVQELCLKIAENAEMNNGNLNGASVRKGEKEWIEESLSTQQASVLEHMNSMETKVGRKNQVIYALGRVTTEDFRYSDIERIVREFFGVPDDRALNLSKILGDFQKGANPLIRRSVRSNHCSFCSPKIRMVIRSMLAIGEDGKVQLR